MTTRAAVVPIAGELHLGTVADWEGRVETAAARSGAVVLDLTGLEFIDSAGVHGLFRMLAAASSQGTPDRARLPEGTTRAPPSGDAEPRRDRAAARDCPARLREYRGSSARRLTGSDERLEPEPLERPVDVDPQDVEALEKEQKPECDHHESACELDRDVVVA